MRETNPTLLLFGMIGLILAAVGLFVFIITALGGGGRSKKTKPVLGNAQTSPQETSEAHQAGALPAPAITTPDHPGEVMRVIRNQQTGQMLIQVDGQQYAHIREIKDAQVGRRVLWAIADLLRFTGGMAANPQALQNIQRPKDTGAAQPIAKQTPEPAPVAKPVQATQQVTQLASPPLAAPIAPRRNSRTPQQIQEQSEQKLDVGKTIGSFFTRGFQAKRSAPPTITSFIDQVETILQRRIDALPTPLPHAVHVQSGVNGALEIEVGLNVYNSPDDVPDPTIRKLIQDAAAEWEKG